MTEFARALAEKNFVVTAALTPPRGVNLKPLLDLAPMLAGRVDAVVVADNRNAVARQSPIAAGLELQRAGLEVIITVACRDRNRLALTSDLLAAAACGLRNILMVSGDFVTLGDQPETKPVYDLDSVQALHLAGELMAGRDLSGAVLDGAPDLFPGSTLAAAAAPLPPQILKFRKKLRAGAQFFITRPISDPEQLKYFLEQAGLPEVRILAGMEADTEADLERSAELVRAVRASELAAGVHLSLPADQNLLPQWLALCGL